MLSKYIKHLEPIIYELDGKRIDKIDGVLIPEYLYSFPNGIWLSFELDERDNYFDVKLGRLFLFDDVMPRIVVLENIEYYFSAINELKLGSVKYKFSHMTYEVEKIFEILKENLMVIINNYSRLIENEKVKNSISKEEKRLESYLLKNLSDSSNLEDELKKSVEEYKGKINKCNSSKMLKKENKRKIAKTQFIDGLYNVFGELLFRLVLVAIGLFILWTFSLKLGHFKLPLAAYILFGIVSIIVLGFIITLIVLIVKSREK